MQFLKTPNFDFLGLGRICLAVSALLVVGSIGLVANVFASYFVSKFLFEWVLGDRKVDTLSI